MTTMTAAGAGTQPTQPVYAGIDTHKATHHVALVDEQGHALADREFTTTRAGERAITAWLGPWRPVGVGVEQTGTYGAGITRALTRAGQTVVEVNAPDPQVRAAVGKSDPIDAVMAANAVRTGRATVAAKNRDGVIESIRLLHAARAGAVKARAAARTQLGDLAILAPAPLREQLGTTSRQITAAALRLRPDHTRLDQPTQAAKAALRSIARRVRDLDTEIAHLDTALDILVSAAAPRLLRLPQVGTHAAAQLLITYGQAADRITSDAAFARLIGVAPIPASSGQTRRMRLHAGGDRQANKTVHMIAVGRLRHHQPAIDYYKRRQHEGLSKKDTIRAMKRLITRELYGALKADLTALDEL